MSKPTLTELQSLSDQVQRIRDEIQIRRDDIAALQVSLEYGEKQLVNMLAEYLKDNPLPILHSNESH